MQHSLLYLYAFIPSSEYEQQPPQTMPGMEPDYEVEFRPFGGVTAVTCQVPQEEYAENKLQQKVEDLQWLKSRAFHHHETIQQLHRAFTVLPLKFATIYEHENHLKEAVTTHESIILSSLDYTANKEEWNVKIFADKDTFISEVVTGSTAFEEKKQEMEQLSPGKRFFAKKKIDQFIEQKAEEEIDHVCEAFHQELQRVSDDTEVKKNWERKVTGRHEEMSWNGAYLVDGAEKEGFLALIEKKQHENSGLVFEATGPWPPYHFSEFTDRGEKRVT